MRVLLMEDCSDLRHLFARILRLVGVEVHEAADGSEASACLPSAAPELVLTDLMMPVLDGLELIRRLRAMPGMDGVPIVAMTAETLREVHRAGAIDLLEKPLDFRTLICCVGTYG